MKKTLFHTIAIVGLIGMLLFVHLAIAADGLAPLLVTPFPSSLPWPPAIPNRLNLVVRETSGVARDGEIVRSGVPLPRSLNVTDAAALALVDAADTPLPAEFQVLARWNAPRDEASAPIQWLLVTFPASLPPNGSATYHLVTDGSAGPNPPPAVPLILSQNNNQITVNTGAAIFTLGGDDGALFDEIRLADGTLMVSGSEMTAITNGVEVTHPVTRRVWVEHAGPLSAVVVIEGEYNFLPLGGGGLSSFRRYLFTAGSPVALVRQAINWEGDLCPSNGWDLTCDGNVNGVLLTRWRDALSLNFSAPFTVTAVGDFEAAALEGVANVGEEAWVRQLLRAERTASLAFEVSVPGANASGEKADGGMLAVTSNTAMVAIALDHMHRYEPQALRLLADGQLAIDLADDKSWLGQRQGTFATFGVGVFSLSSGATLQTLLWPSLNHPLHAWPSPEWWAASGAVDELPLGDLAENLAGYDSLVPDVLSETLQKIDEKGIAGLLTFGLYPRYWGNPLYGDELDCGENDPTPGEAWDDKYWCGTWTDYHNTTATAAIWAMRSGEVAWLDELAFPAALRTLHTQIMQCAADDDWFYCGQSPAGYGGYRSDFNSSHAYFDNLFLYYWLTGDYTVVEMVQRGASTMRDYLCFRRPTNPCLPDDLPDDDWAFLTGRVAAQWTAAFRFVGLAGDDASYLEDYQATLARAVTQNYVEVEQNGRRYGFWLYGIALLSGSGTYSTDQLWMATLYDMNNLYRLQVDTDDAPLGNPLIPPSQVITAWARTLVDFGATVSGDGTAGGQWPNALYFTWMGERVGGTLLDVTANTGGGDPYLYNTGKATLTATLLRAADEAANLRDDNSLWQMGESLTLLALDAAQSEFAPLGKIQGEYLARLPAAVARLNGVPAPTMGEEIYLPLVINGSSE
jgi:hypothetical protein